MSEPSEELYHLGKSILMHMGLVIASWGILETQIELLILRYQEIPSGTGLLLTTNLTYRAKADLLLTFADGAEDIPGDERKILKQLVRRADRLYAKRNMVAHSAWLPTEDPQKARVMGIRTRGKLRLTNEEIHVNDLKKIAQELRDLGREIIAFMERNNIRPEDGY